MLSRIPNYLSFVPLHQQFVSYIRLKIGSKGFCKGDRLPPVKTMSLYYNIPVSMIKKAYSTLMDDGVIVLIKQEKAYFFNDFENSKVSADINGKINNRYQLSNA